MAFRSILVFFLFVALSGSLATSCQAKKQPNGVENRIQRLSEGLNLTPEQVDSIRDILTDADKKRGKVPGQKEMPQQGGPDKERQFRAEIDNRILAVLNPEQRAKYQKMRNAKPSDKNLRELKEKLHLSEEQMQSVEMILVSNAEKIEAVKRHVENKDPKQFHLAMKEVMESQAKQIEELLTKDQIAVFKIMRTDRKRQMEEKRPDK